MTDFDSILKDLRGELFQSLGYLEFSYKKVSSDRRYVSDSKDPDVLESFEALVSRFARTTDIFVARYLRSIAEKDDPAFRGGLRDWVNYAEKKGIISSAQEWMEIRELRNRISHEYASKDLSDLFQKVLEKTPLILKLKLVIK